MYNSSLFMEKSHLRRNLIARLLSIARTDSRWFSERIVIFLTASGERSWGRHTVHFRATAGGRRGLLPAELFPTRPGRCGGRPHLLHQFRQDRQPERAAQDRVGRLWHAEREDAIPRSHLGTIWDKLSAVPHDRWVLSNTKFFSILSSSLAPLFLDEFNFPRAERKSLARPRFRDVATFF